MIESVNIAWCVKRWSELHPRKTAIIYEKTHISYAELHQRVNQTSCWLQAMGIEKGSRVAVMLNNCPEFIDIYLACSRLGAIFVPINFRLAAPELEYTLNNARPRLFIFGDPYCDIALRVHQCKRPPVMILASIPRCELSDEVLDYRFEVAAYKGQKPFLTKSMAPAAPEEPHVIMYTSGTTGKPKGAVLSHRKTFFNCLNADIFFKLNFDDVMLIVLPLFHSGGLFIQASPIIFKGAAMIIHPKFDPLQTYQAIRDYGVTKFLGVPTIYKALDKAAHAHRELGDSLKVCAIGGEKSTPEVMAQLCQAGFPLRQIMGQTETSILLWASKEDILNKPGSVGKPVFHAEVKVFDRHDRACEPGQIGEIVVRGSVMMTEYWLDPQKTEATIRGGWLHTGDLAYTDDDGCFYLVDRAKDMYISGGENVYPAEVERVLKKHASVDDVAIVGEPDDTWGEVGHAFVIPEPDTAPQPRDIISFCDGRLARYKWPRRVTFVNDLPRTALGKVRKVELKDQLTKN